jgi:hypothetical protein
MMTRTTEANMTTATKSISYDKMTISVTATREVTPDVGNADGVAIRLDTVTLTDTLDLVVTRNSDGTVVAESSYLAPAAPNAPAGVVAAIGNALLMADKAADVRRLIDEARAAATTPAFAAAKQAHDKLLVEREAELKAYEISTLRIERIMRTGR